MAIFSAAILLPVWSRSAAADQISDAQAQANQLAAQIAQMGTRIHQLTERYSQANQRAALVASQLDQDRAQLVSTQRDVDATRALLRIEAVNAYIHSLPARTGSLTTGSPAVNVLVSREYLSVATGGVKETVDRLRVAVETLRATADALRTEEQAARRVSEQVTAARQAALAEAGNEEATLTQVRGHLADLVAQAEAARVAAARVAAARAEGARSAVAAARVPAQGLPVAGGLLSAVSAAVSAPVPAAVLAPAARSAPAAPAALTARPAPAAPVAPLPPANSGAGAGGVWAALRQCESGGNYAENVGNGFYGAYQFSQSTWSGLGYPSRPDLEPPSMQDQAAQKLQAADGWAPWPACARALGLL
jgi:hypothetical protein